MGTYLTDRQWMFGYQEARCRKNILSVHGSSIPVLRMVILILFALRASEYTCRETENLGKSGLKIFQHIMARDILKAAKSASNAVAVHKKYTVQSTGIWERIRRLLAVDPNRSTGVPLNSQYRLPTPGAIPPQSYDDPVTIPAGDIADNPYWKRDVRRNYPRLSTVSQADAVGLLTVGSRAQPKDDVLQIGQAGEQQLVAVKQQGEERGLAAVFEKDKRGVQGVLGADGLPPIPCNLNASAAKYQLGEGQGYPAVYPCRTFV